jgi:hypothetical protein
MITFGSAVFLSVLSVFELHPFGDFFNYLAATILLTWFLLFNKLLFLPDVDNFGEVGLTCLDELPFGAYDDPIVYVILHTCFINLFVFFRPVQ